MHIAYLSFAVVNTPPEDFVLAFAENHCVSIIYIVAEGARGNEALA